MALVRVPPDGAPAAEPVSLEEARMHCRVDHTDEDMLIEGLISAARDYAEAVTRRTLLPGTWDYAMDAFPAGAGAIRLPMPPLVEVLGVHYVDPDGAPVEMDSEAYQVDTRSEPARIVPAYGTSWPTTRPMPSAAWVRYRAGYDVTPPGIRQAILLLVGHWFAQREAVVVGTITAQVPLAVDALLWPYRVLEAS